MLRSLLQFLLRRYLGENVNHVPSVEDLKIGLIGGEINLELKGVQLKAETLNALDLPIRVKAGFVGSVTIKVPYTRLRKDPVLVILDRIFILAEPPKDDRTFTEEDKQRWYEEKRRKCEVAELAMFEAKDMKNTVGLQESEYTTKYSLLSSVKATLLSFLQAIAWNSKVSITNVHIRYEDTVSIPGRHIVSGVTLATLAAETVDENGNEAIVCSGALERLRKSGRLERLAVYHDGGRSPWCLDKAWNDMTFLRSESCDSSLQQVFMEGIKADPSNDKSLSKWSIDRQYLLHPVGALMTYCCRGEREQRKPEVPLQAVTLVLEPVSVTVSEAQYCDGMKLLSTYRTRLQYSHLRPQTSILDDQQAWWLYACKAVLQQHSIVWYRLLWSSIADACRKRRRYVQLYASCLNQGSKVDNQEIKDMEKDLDGQVILLWRLLARAESVKLKEERALEWKSSRWSSSRGSANSAQGSASTTPTDDSPTPSSDAPGQLTEEEWSKTNEFLTNCQPGEDVALNVSEFDAVNMMQIGFDVNIQQVSARVLDSDNKEILCGVFENLQVGIQVYPKTLACEGKLQYYAVSAPEGMLIESVRRLGRDYAMSATYVQAPSDENLDWKLAANMSRCHVKVWRISFERFLLFLKSSQALSPGVALETASVLQNKLENVTRRAQVQLQQALEQQSRFSIQLDLDAPKISIPVKARNSDDVDTQLLLDLGHFTLHTATDSNRDKDIAKLDIYSSFSISGKEIAAYVVDRDVEWSEVASLSSGDISQSPSGILPVLDPCGMSLVLDQIRVQHPDYPSTRLAIQVPSLGIHFSPALGLRLMSVLSALGGADKAAEEFPAVPWQRSDYSSGARLLVWGGLGSTVAEWQPCRAVLAGTYLYILESESAHTYHRCISVTGKQVVEVPSANIGNFENVLAICHRGVETQKVVKSSSALILQIESEDLKAAWQYYLAQIATYKAPAPLLSKRLESSDDHDDEKEKEELRANQSQVLVMLVLQESRMSLSNTASSGASSCGGEKLILELQAHCTKVSVMQSQHDTSISMRVHSLRIEDKFGGHVAPSCRYLLRSSLSPDGEEEEEEEVFHDASAELNVPGSSSSSVHGFIHRFFSSDRGDLTSSQEMFLRDWEADLMNQVGSGGIVQDLWVDGADEEVSDFGIMRLCIRQTDSPSYDDTDVQMIIRMTTLHFFCNRPTVVALMQLSNSTDDPPSKPANEVVEAQDTKESPREVVKGLLGRGKSQVVFGLKMEIESARVSLNKEDGTQLGMIAQDDFQFDLKVYPGSLTISGTLGNLRVCDMLLGADHQWGWICDIQDPGAGSLVELKYQTYNKDDDDYQGYDSSLLGKLSAVRIVFLHRFIQEISAYFDALVTPQTSQAVDSVKDKAGGAAELIQQSDNGGSPVVKLDFSLDNPTIIMPCCSDSEEFMQLDLRHLEVRNSFELDGDKDLATTVHLGVLHAKLRGINMVVGIGGQPGKPMLREAGGLDVIVNRPLRDLLKKVPELAVDVQVPLLSAALTHNQYSFIIYCANTNMSETPTLPPTFRECAKMSGEEKVLLEAAGESEVDKTPIISDAFVYTKIRVNMDIHQVTLDLSFDSKDSEIPLARLEIQKLRLNYCTSSANNMDVRITLSKLSVLDQRSDTRPEMRLMLGPGSMEPDVKKPAIPEEDDSDSPELTMLVLDLRCTPDSQAYEIRMQRPRLVVVVDFLLAVGEFFKKISSENDTEILVEDIRLSTPLHRQEEDTIVLSCDRQLIAEAYDVDEFVYDGCGKTLLLDVENGQEPLIVLGPGKELRFKNIYIENGFWLSEFVHLSPNSRYTASLDDDVILDGIGATSMHAAPHKNSLLSTGGSSIKRSNEATGSNFVELELDIQAVGPELTFYDSSKWPAGSPPRERMLSVNLDCYIMMSAKGDDRRINGVLKGLTVKGGSGLVVVDPLDATAEYSCDQEKINLAAGVSDISTRLTFSVLSLISRFQDDALSTLNLGAAPALARCTHFDTPALARCTHFDRIWVIASGDNITQQVAIWRPRAPFGYLTMGDCATSGVAPPTQAVMAISGISKFSQNPVGFDLLWSTTGEYTEADADRDDVVSGDCSVWMPVAPPGHIPLGCVAERGLSPPSLSSVQCIRTDMVTSGSLSDCIHYDDGGRYKTGCSIWRIANAAGSFYAHPSTSPPSRPLIRDLSETLVKQVSHIVTGMDRPANSAPNHGESSRRMSSVNIAGGRPPKMDNVVADVKLEIKVGRLSATVFDDMGGLMKPLLKTTITNMKLAGTGRLKAMTSTIVTNIAASTFNTQLGCWEPFIEPVDIEGSLRYETNDEDSEPKSKIGKQLRKIAAKAVNLNVTSAGLETLVESFTSWRKQTELSEEQARMSLEMEGSDYREPDEDYALEEDELEKIRVQNLLGCDLFVSRFVDGKEKVDVLKKNSNHLVHLPPARFPDISVHVSDSRPPGQFAAIDVSEAKFFSKKSDKNEKTGGIDSGAQADMRLWLAVSPQGPWNGLRSIVPATTVSMEIGGRPSAVEITLQQDQKCLKVRSLTTVLNRTDMALDVCLCPFHLLITSDKTQHPLVGRQMVGVVQPGDSIPLPLAGSDILGTDMCVQFRPHSDSSQYTWGLAAESGEGSSVPARHPESNLPVSALPLKELKNTEEIIFCRALEAGREDNLFWLNVDVAATLRYNSDCTIHSDWRITVSAPVKLENHLPSSAAYTIWEDKPSTAGNLNWCQHGNVSAGGSVYIYSVDVRRPMYLDCSLQGWVSRVRHILISDPTEEDRPADGFQIRHQGSGRWVYVTLEHDFDDYSSATKIVRLFVPYWLSNDACLNLAYRLVEIKPNSASTGHRAAAVRAAQRPSHSGAKHAPQLHTVVDYFSEVRDMTATPVMLYDGLGEFPLSSPEDGLPSPHLGLSIGLANGNVFKHALSFRDLASNMERVSFNAVDNDGSYYKLSIFLDGSPYRTKVIHVQPHTLFVNRLGRRLSLRQCHMRHEEIFCPNDPPKTILWQPTEQPELLEINVDGYRWSHPFSVHLEGIFHVELEAEGGGSRLVIRGEVRNGAKDSQNFVLFRLAARQSPYRLENRSTVVPIKFRQAESDQSSWKVLRPGSSASFAWENLARDHLLEILPEAHGSLIRSIDEPFGYQPFPSIHGGAAAPLRATVISEGFTKVFILADYTPDAGNIQSSVISTPQSLTPEFHNPRIQFHTSIELAEFDISIVDHTPEELLYVSIQNLVLSHATGLESGINRVKFQVDSLQIDNQLPLTLHPVLLMLKENQTHPCLKCTIDKQDNGVLDDLFYSSIEIQGPNEPFFINIHEPLIWRLHEMFAHIDFGRLNRSKTTVDIAIDPIIRFGLLNTSEIRLKVTLAVVPAQRPRGMVGRWEPLLNLLGYTREMPIRITPQTRKDFSMQQSAMWPAVSGRLKKDVLSQLLQLSQLWSGLDMPVITRNNLEIVCSFLAALSMDGKFKRGRQEQATVRNLGEGIREGAEAFVKAYFRGLTGIVTKPIEGALDSGLEGFIKGVGKGCIGCYIQPWSGVLNFFSKTAEGGIATWAAIMFEQKLRRRLPRVIGGDKVLRPFDEYKARGQVMMQLAERRSCLQAVDFLKVRKKCAVSDVYEDHFELPKGLTLIITNRRVLLLKHPTSMIQREKPDLLQEPCTIKWDVMLHDLQYYYVSTFRNYNEASQELPPSRLIIRSPGGMVSVKCHPRTKQADEVLDAIRQVLNSSNPSRSSSSTQVPRCWSQ